MIASLAFYDMVEQLPEAILFRYRSLCWLFVILMKAQRTVMIKVDSGLAGRLHGSALPPCQHMSESCTSGQHSEGR